MDLKIEHDKKNQKFFAVIGGKEAYLQYIISNTSTMNMIKTYVPYELRGQGIAGKIAEEALNYAKQNFYKVIPSCSYVDVYMERHEEYNNMRI